MKVFSFYRILTKVRVLLVYVEVIFMKISLSWIFDHIIGTFKEYDINVLVNLFNKTTAEIEKVDLITCNLDNFFLAEVAHITDKGVTLFCDELDKEFFLNNRSDQAIGKAFIIFARGTDIRWATLGDWGASKEGLLPAFSCGEREKKGRWKAHFEATDYIFTIDNKSITHRPDLWSHRGVAREIAALLQLSLVCESDLIDFPEKKSFEKSTNQDKNLIITVADNAPCKRFSAVLIEDIVNRDSSIFMAHRLIRLDASAINVLVDTTNYIMFDIGQPLHAFDADKIYDLTLNVRLARTGEHMILLDQQNALLSNEDLVIADSQKLLSLAGIMGGLSSCVSVNTSCLIVEAACFNGSAIRKSSTRHKKRTEASIRFEKNIDPHLTIYALKRFFTLIKKIGIDPRKIGDIVTIGPEPKSQKIVLSHDLIESKLGMPVSKNSVERILKNIEFDVIHNIHEGISTYAITAPHFRSTRDTLLPEDIIEEVGRFLGYDNIPLIPPTFSMRTIPAERIYRQYDIKRFLSLGLRAREVMNYAFFDEEFLTTINWQPDDSATLKNPVSQHWKRLVTSLIPHLLKNVYTNKFENHPLRFFECNRIWSKNNGTVIEKKSIAIVLFDKKPLSFYESKELLINFFDALHLPVSWKSHENNLKPWHHPYQTATLICHDAIIGYAGKIDPSFLINFLEGDAFIAELDGDFITNHRSAQQAFKPLSKFPATWWDISMFIPLSLTVDQIVMTVEKSDSRIFKVEVIDYFEKEEWIDYRSVTIRFYARDEIRTLTKEEIDHIYNHATIALKKNGATIR